MRALHIKNSYINFLVALLFGSVIFFSIYVSMLKPPIRGIADQGDFERMMVWIGAKYQSVNYDIKYFNWINRFYDVAKPEFGEVFSSEQIFLYISRFVNLLFNRSIFDINILGIIHAIIFSIVLTINYHYLKKTHLLYGLLFIPFSLLAFTDIGYTAYFNSFYQESSGIIFLFLTTFLILKSILEIGSKKDIKNFIILTISSILLITAKSQYFVIFIPITITIYMIFRKTIPKKYLILVGAILSLTSLIYYFLGTPNIIKRWNVYNSVFPQVVGSAKDQVRAMKILGFDQKFLKYSGIPAYISGNGIDDPQLQESLNPIVFPKIVLYYFSTPKELIALASEVTRQSLTLEVNYLGYYENTKGEKPLQMPDSFNIWSKFRSTQLVNLHQLLLPFLILSSISAIVIYFATNSKIAIPIFFLTSSALSQFFVLVFSQGLSCGVSKLMILFNIQVDLVVFIIVSSFLANFYKVFTKRIMNPQ